jgi:hypothetical protein
MRKELKQLFFFVILLAVFGFASFLYRATLEAPSHNTNIQTIACTMEAKICPDGTSVGRSGPSCEFAACPAPNVEIPSAGLAFAIPAGYRADQAHGADASLLGAFEKTAITGSSTQPDSISVRRYAIPEGKDANSVMLANTSYEPSGESPASMEEFTPVIINGHTYQMVRVERFEGVVRVLYYLPRDTDVIRFEAVARDVPNWTDPGLAVRSLRAVSSLELMLSGLQSR